MPNTVERVNDIIDNWMISLMCITFIKRLIPQTPLHDEDTSTQCQSENVVHFTNSLKLGIERSPFIIDSLQILNVWESW